MGYLEQTLLPDERVLYTGHLHWILYKDGLMVTSSALLALTFERPVLTWLFGDAASEPLIRIFSAVLAIFLAAGLVLLFSSTIRWWSTEFVISNRRLMVKRGFIRRHVFEIMSRRISGASLDQSLLGRLLGYGTVRVRGTGGEISRLGSIANPEGFHRALLEVADARINGRLLRQQRRQKNVPLN